MDKKEGMSMNNTNEKEYSKLFSNALALAATKHAGQIRKDGTPYIFHPLRVSQMIKDAGFDVRYQIAGLFHDLLEDTDATEDEIKAYGEDILEATKLVSKNYCNDKDKYIDNILKNHMAAVVKNADRIDNLIDAREADKDFKIQYLEDSNKKYKGRFSSALDSAIESLRISLSYCKKEMEKAQKKYSKKDMELYSDEEKRATETRKEALPLLLERKKQSSVPDKKNHNFVYIEACGFYFCGYEIPGTSKFSKVWMLTDAGWIEEDIDLCEEFGLDMDITSRNVVLNEFRKQKEKGNILEFVTEDDI